MPFVTAGVVAAGVGAAGSIAGSLISADASSKAGKQQAQAARDAANYQKEMYGNNRNELQPYINTGYDSNTRLNTLFQGSYDDTQNTYQRTQDAIPGSMGQSELEATPGYQFNLSQGLRAVQNNAAAKGLGVSGAAMQGASQYATGLANSTYRDQFNIKQQQFQDANQQFANQLNRAGSYYNQTIGQSQLGSTSANALANAGTAAANGYSSAIQGAGQATAAGTLGQGKAYAGLINNAVGGATGAYGTYDQLFGNNAPATAGNNNGQPQYSTNQLLNSFSGAGGSGFNGTGAFGA